MHQFPAYALRPGHGAAGAQHAVVMDGAYHGHTTATIDLSPYKFNGPGGSGKCVDSYRRIVLTAQLLLHGGAPQCVIRVCIAEDALKLLFCLLCVQAGLCARDAVPRQPAGSAPRWACGSARRDCGGACRWRPRGRFLLGVHTVLRRPGELRLLLCPFTHAACFSSIMIEFQLYAATAAVRYGLNRHSSVVIRRNVRRYGTAQVVLPEGYLSDVYEEMRAEGAVCVADEVCLFPASLAWGLREPISDVVGPHCHAFHLTASAQFVE